MTNKNYQQSGQILALAIVVVGVVLLNTLIIIAGSTIYYQNTNYSVASTQATNLAEAGIDKAMASLNATAGTYAGESETVLGEGSFSVTITSPNSSTKVINSTGYIPNKADPKSTRTIQTTASKGSGISFSYAVQVGEGGMEMGNSNNIQGSIYSNGNIVGNNSNSVTGDVWVAGGVAPSPDQETDCTGASCSDFLFGKNISGQNRLDIAQSFQPLATKVLNKISLKLKKFGSPPDLTVRILSNNGGSPNKNGVLATGTLQSSLVTSSYGFVDVTFNTSPNLTANTTYWIMLDTSSDNSNYWSWQNDTLQSYTRGQPKWSPSWNASNPSWNNLTGGGDLSFKTYTGGVATSITGSNGFTVGGDVRANTIQHLNISGDAYYQTISQSSVSGTEYPGSADPPPQVMPISDANLTDWKNEAEAVGVSTGNITNCVSTLGPGKIVGNVTFGNSCNVTVKTPIWVTGTFHLNNSNILTLDSSYGSTSGVIMVEGVSDLDNSNQLNGSGASGSVLILLSLYDSRTNGINAININNSGNTGVLYAGTGTIDVKNSSTFKELTAWKIKLNNSSTLIYDSGLAGLFFSSGPGGSYALVKGSYQLK